LAGRLFTPIGVIPRDYRSIYGHGVAPELYLSDAGNTDRFPVYLPEAYCISRRLDPASIPLER
jgi:hypothetical protein